MSVSNISKINIPSAAKDSMYVKRQEQEATSIFDKISSSKASITSPSNSAPVFMQRADLNASIDSVSSQVNECDSAIEKINDFPFIPDSLKQKLISKIEEKKAESQNKLHTLNSQLAKVTITSKNQDNGGNL